MSPEGDNRQSSPWLYVHQFRLINNMPLFPVCGLSLQQKPFIYLVDEGTLTMSWRWVNAVQQLYVRMYYMQQFYNYL